MSDRSRSRIPFAIADAVALMVFVVAGIRSHHEVGASTCSCGTPSRWRSRGSPSRRSSGTYRRPGIRTLVWTWIVAVPAGLVVRSIWVGSPSGGRLLVFVGIGLVFTLVFLLAGRAVVGLVDRRRRPADALPLGARNVIR